MTRDPVGGRGVAMIDAVRRLDPGTILTTILVCGLLLRVFIAGVYLPLSGLGNDLAAFNAWGQRMAADGPGSFYAEGYFADYPPGYLYVLWLLGEIGAALTPVVGQNATGGLVKIPAIAADVGVAWLLFIIARRWGPQLLAGSPFRVTPTTLGLAAATVYLFNPGTIFDSAVWGQVDSVGTLVLLGTIVALGRGWTEVAAVGAVVALLVKFQFGFLVPVVAVVGIRRHLIGRSSDPEHDAQRAPLRVLTSLAAGFASMGVLLVPFNMTLFTAQAGGMGCFGLPAADPVRSLVGKLCEASATYTGLTINAFSLWRNPFSGLGDTFFRGDDTVVGIALLGVQLTWQQVGTLLFAAVVVVALWQVARRDDLRGILLAALLIAIAFFVLPTRVHERYLFPALALAAPRLLSGRLWPWVYGGLSLVLFTNVYWVYTEDWTWTGSINNPGRDGQPMAQDPFLTATLLTDAGIWLISLLGVGLLLVVGWRSVRLAQRQRDPDAVETLPDPDPAPRPAPVPRVPRRASGLGIGWLRPDPADPYLREPRRRLDRRDALLLLGLVVFALVFRLWRLDLPRGQHFDEVYHARSATEFLSSWAHGWDRDVYEWTHPMLAKYLIAGGILLADPNQITDTRSLDDGSVALTVAPRHASEGRDRSIAFHVSPPGSVVATDAESGDEVARWQVGGPIATLAVDRHAPRLLVGRADGGRVETYELAGLLASPDGRAPPAGPPIETDLESVNAIVVPDETDEPLLLRGPNGVVVVDPEGDALRGRIDGTFGGAEFVRAPDDESAASVVVSDPATGTLAFHDSETLAETTSLGVDAPLRGPLVMRGSGDDQQLFALTGPLPPSADHGAVDGGIAALDADGSHHLCDGDPCLIGLVPLPGAGTLIGLQPVAGMVYVAGTAPDGNPELWTLERHVEDRGDGTIGLAAFDTTALPGTPTAMAFDVASTAQGDDRGRILLATAGDAGAGAIVEVDAGSNGFAWRLAGVIAGSLIVGLVYLLAATMFSRRGIAILAAAFVALDGMSYTMSRIAMNDIFVALFIVAAYVVFWQVWSGRWARSAWWALPLTGVLIGLAAATKWVGFYALAGLLVLVLARSALGRLVLVVLVALATVVGGIGAPWPFLLAMLVVLALALAVSWARPPRFDVREALVALPSTVLVLTGAALAFVLAYDSIEASDPGGPVEYLFSLLARGVQAGWPAWLLLAAAGVLVAWRAVVSLRDPASDARWYRPGEMGGFAWAWAGACLVVIPLAVYAVSYLPYVALGHPWAGPDAGPGYGWSVDSLHRQMYGYHFNLTAGHASSSPWWSWPLVLKPTWFHSSSFDGGQMAMIYNGGNPVLFWAGIPALVACGVLAWKRRSAALALLVAAFAFQYVPWLRIERATFAYHYVTAVLFAMIAVAYLVDELLRRPAWRQVAIGFLAAAAIAGLLVFPLGAALPMPDWYINAARALPPWQYGFQFPDPPAGDRGELVSASGLTMVLGLVVAAIAAVIALVGRDWWERRAEGPPPSAVPERG